MPPIPYDSESCEKCGNVDIMYQIWYVEEHIMFAQQKYSCDDCFAEFMEEISCMDLTGDPWYYMFDSKTNNFIDHVYAVIFEYNN